MNRFSKGITKFFLSSMVISGALALLISCEGRRVDNMVPNGETVEVVIPSPVELDPQPQQADSLLNQNNN